ncbi:MAG: GTPase Era [Chitinophagales bacterium]
MSKETTHKAGFVNIIGKPNAGKSTLMNVLVGENLAIITSKAQTTRHRIMGIVNGDDFQIVYSDTPGIIVDPHYKMQEAMMRFVNVAFKDADVVLLLADLSEKDNLIPWYEDRLKKVNVPVVVLLNKTDLVSDAFTEEQMALWEAAKFNPQVVIPISALKKTNMNLVFGMIIKNLPEHPPYYDKESLTDKDMRFFVSEIIREKILLNYKQEIPYSVEIVVESYKEEKNITRIRALIITNRKSHKPILIGKGGSMLKRVGTQAREDIEEFLQQKVFLELFVKIKENWRDDDLFLKNMGYR